MASKFISNIPLTDNDVFQSNISFGRKYLVTGFKVQLSKAEGKELPYLILGAWYKPANDLKGPERYLGNDRVKANPDMITRDLKFSDGVYWKGMRAQQSGLKDQVEHYWVYKFVGNTPKGDKQEELAFGTFSGSHGKGYVQIGLKFLNGLRFAYVPGEHGHIFDITVLEYDDYATSISSVPMDCRMSNWSNWGTCQDNRKMRYRFVLVKPANGGAPCPTETKQYEPCKMEVPGEAPTIFDTLAEELAQEMGEEITPVQTLKPEAQVTNTTEEVEVTETPKEESSGFTGGWLILVFFLALIIAAVVFFARRNKSPALATVEV